MPRPRESLKSAKTRLAREQQTRTEKRIQALLQPRLTGQDAEIFDDSEEENRLIGRRERAKRDQASKTDISSYSFCCGISVLCWRLSSCILNFCLLLYQTNGKQRMAE